MKLRSSSAVSLLAFLCVPLFATQLSAQNLSNSTSLAPSNFGSSSNQRVGTAAQFLQNRRRGRPGFVGENPRGRTGFIGASASQSSLRRPLSNRPTSSATGASAASVNKPRRAGRGNEEYDPPLVIAFSAPRIDAQETALALNELLDQTLGSTTARQIKIAVEERTAVVAGIVPTEQQRDLILTMIQMEPGISRVVDRLQVRE